jgi:multiple sugar transport system substrate-binding protein
VNRRALAAAATAVLAGGACARDDSGGTTTIRFWGMGREGEVVQELVRDFEREHPGLRVEVQQIPWSAAHEKLLTAYVGRSTPDVAQLGNTWIAEFVALGALEPLDDRLGGGIDASEYFDGIWDTNVLDGATWGVPWYVDTRVLFYRTDLLRAAGHDTIPTTWRGWREAMEAVKRAGGPGKYAILLPINEWNQPIILGLQAGSPLLADRDTRGAFSEPEFARAFGWYLDLFRDGLAPPVANTEIANLYQELARGYFAMYVTGPWNLGEFERRLPEELQDDWSTAPLPGPDEAHPGVSLAGGSSLVLFREAKHKAAAWELVRWLSRPDVQLRFHELTGDLPARVAAWQDPALRDDARIRAFRRQLERVVSTPKIPEWEQIAALVLERTELAIRGGASPSEALGRLDEDVARILEKRRWLLSREAARGGAGGSS